MNQDHSGPAPPRRVNLGFRESVKVGEGFMRLLVAKSKPLHAWCRAHSTVEAGQDKPSCLFKSQGSLTAFPDYLCLAISTAVSARGCTDGTLSSLAYAPCIDHSNAPSLGSVRPCPQQAQQDSSIATHQRGASQRQPSSSRSSRLAHSLQAQRVQSQSPQHVILTTLRTALP